MHLSSKVLIITLICFYAVVPVAHAGISGLPVAGLNFNVSEEFSCGIKGSMSFNQQLDQADNLQVPYVGKLNTPFLEKGYTGWSIAPWYSIQLAKVGKINITGGGDIGIISRTFNKDSLPDAPDYLEVRPAGVLAMQTTVVNIIQVQFTNRFERRLIRSPWLYGSSVSYFRYASCFSIASDPFTALKIVPSLIYEGYYQADARHLSVTGGGISIEPFSSVSLDLSYKVLWEGSGKNNSEHRIGAYVGYTFDFTE